MRQPIHGAAGADWSPFWREPLGASAVPGLGLSLALTAAWVTCGSHPSPRKAEWQAAASEAAKQ